MKMEKLFSHYLSYINYVICKYICYVMFIECFTSQHSHSTLGVMSTEIFNNNISTSLLSRHDPDIFYSSMSSSEIFSSTALPITTSSTLDFVTSNAPDTTPIHGWQCHCWNSTNGSEVCVLHLWLKL